MYIIGCKGTKKKRVSQIAGPIFTLFKYFDREVASERAKSKHTIWLVRFLFVLLHHNCRKG